MPRDFDEIRNEELEERREEMEAEFGETFVEEFFDREPRVLGQERKRAAQRVRNFLDR